MLQVFDTIEEYADLRRWLLSLKAKNQISAWGDAVRWYIENDLFYVVSDVISDGRTINTSTGQPLYWNQFYVDWCRQVEWQIANGGGFDGSARGTGKSTIRTKASTIQRMVKHPRSSGCLFSFQKKSSRKHFLGIKEECERNVLLRTACDDVFYWDPRAAAKAGEAIWSLDLGLRVKGSERQNLTLEYNAFFDGTPTGGRYDRLDFDDIEDHKAIGTPEMLEKLHATYDATILLATPVVLDKPVVMFTNTFYTDIGLAARVYRKCLDEDPRKARIQSGENLTVPGDGPLGGTPQYPLDRERLYFYYDGMRDKREYAIQLCCSFLAGEDRRFHDEWLHHYPGTGDAWGRGKNIYICIDPSRGVTDPMVAWVWALGSDKKISWVDCLMKRLDPALPQFYDEIFMLASKWSNIGKRLVQIRVENFGQATFASSIKNDLIKRGFYADVIGCADNVRTGKFVSGKRDREFERWAKPAVDGDILIPKPVTLGGPGLMRPDESGHVQDLVEYFLRYEWSKFPKPITDNMLDAGSLLWEPTTKVGGHILQYPAATTSIPSSDRKRMYGQGGLSAMSMG